MLAKTNAQSVSRVLRVNGYSPSSTESLARWPGLLCRKSGDEVRIRVWRNELKDTPGADDRACAAEIAALLASKGYTVRYTIGEYFLYVAGKGN